MQAMGERNLAERFLTHMAEGLPREQVGTLIDVAFAMQEPHIALIVRAWRAAAAAGRQSAGRFTDKYFASKFVRRLAPVLALTLLPEEDDDGVKLCC